MLWRIAWVVLAIGAGATVHSLRITPDRLRRLAMRRTTLQALQAWQRASEADASVLKVFRGLASGRAPELETLAEGLRVGLKPETRLLAVEPAMDGWVVRRVEAVFPRARFSDVEVFAGRAGQTRPPWRLISATLTATDTSGGMGRAELVFESLARDTMPTHR